MKLFVGIFENFNEKKIFRNVCRILSNGCTCSFVGCVFVFGIKLYVLNVCFFYDFLFIIFFVKFVGSILCLSVNFVFFVNSYFFYRFFLVNFRFFVSVFSVFVFMVFLFFSVCSVFCMLFLIVFICCFIFGVVFFIIVN